MNLMLLDSVKSYQYFNEHEVKRILSALIEIVLDNRPIPRWDVKTLKVTYFGGIEIFGERDYTKYGLIKNSKLAKMSPHKQVKYLVKRLLDSLKNSIFADDN